MSDTVTVDEYVGLSRAWRVRVERQTLQVDAMARAVAECVLEGRDDIARMIAEEYRAAKQTLAELHGTPVGMLP